MPLSSLQKHELRAYTEMEQHVGYCPKGSRKRAQPAPSPVQHNWGRDDTSVTDILDQLRGIGVLESLSTEQWRTVLVRVCELNRKRRVRIALAEEALLRLDKIYHKRSPVQVRRLTRKLQKATGGR